MLKMIIEMNENKIVSEGKYDTHTIENLLKGIIMECGLSDLKNEGKKIIVYGNNGDKDLADFFIAMDTLLKCDWFLKNCEYWHLHDTIENEDNDCLEYFSNIEYHRSLRKKGIAYGTV